MRSVTSPGRARALRIGAHIPGGAGKLVANALACGAEALQIFASNPRGWAPGRVVEAQDEAVREGLREASIGPLFVHAPYLVNLASPDVEFRRRSASMLAWTMRRAESLGAAGVVVHSGAAGATPRAVALRRLRAGARLALEAATGPALVVELTAGGSGTIAARWPEAAEVLDAVDGEPRVGFCFDTCHALAAGYDLTTTAGMRACLAEMRREVGARRLALVHANDSRDPVGSRRDRHWHVGEGTIGIEPFRALLADPAVRRVPIVIETPGDLADDARNIARLRELSAGRGR